MNRHLMNVCSTSVVAPLPSSCIFSAHGTLPLHSGIFFRGKPIVSLVPILFNVITLFEHESLCAVQFCPISSSQTIPFTGGYFFILLLSSFSSSTVCISYDRLQAVRMSWIISFFSVSLPFPGLYGVPKLRISMVNVSSFIELRDVFTPNSRFFV